VGLIYYFCKYVFRQKMPRYSIWYYTTHQLQIEEQNGSFRLYS